jgi:hypothetical protein
MNDACGKEIKENICSYHCIDDNHTSTVELVSTTTDSILAANMRMKET